MTQPERKEWLNRVLVELRQEQIAYKEMPGHSEAGAAGLGLAADSLYRALQAMDNQEALLETGAWQK